jgi:cytochrome c-type biogenesis protein CcmH/NrfG
MKLDPPDPQIEALIALVRQGRFSEVLPNVQALAGRFPQSFIVWNLLGNTSLALGRMAEAAQAFRNAAEINPGD